MCGIVGFVRKSKEYRVDDISRLLDLVIEVDGSDLDSLDVKQVNQIHELAKRAISLEGTIYLMHNLEFAEDLSSKSEILRKRIETALLKESINETHKSNLVLLNDALWKISKDACDGAKEVYGLFGAFAKDDFPLQVIAVYRSINLVLRSIDRIEVRGRDSAGVSVNLDSLVIDAEQKKQLEARASSTFLNRSVAFKESADGSIVSFVYKRAAEIGELGDNIAHIRKTIAEDDLLYSLVESNAEIHETVLAHTRWASMGVISEENTHPLDAREVGKTPDHVTLGVLNGDIDNHAALKDNCEIDPSITTDAKLIPVLIEKEIDKSDSVDLTETTRKVVNSFEGSTAISVFSSIDSKKLMLALRGGGQGLFVGLGNDEYLIASEPYGVVEVTENYVRVDGETPSDPSQPVTSRGQIFSVNRDLAGTLEGLTRISYDGTELPLSGEDVIASEVTTRDIDRGHFEHYLWKEINEAPKSFEATTAGKFVLNNGKWSPNILEDIFPSNLHSKLLSREFKNVYIIGQGTASVAAQACAHFFSILNTELNVQSLLASELSGFHLKEDMQDCLVIAVSQSGTTTDTNRTVDLLKDRGASVIAIVNRRGSDLSTKADGVCYTSSGRDVEMSVASTKAFYAQVAAGAYLAFAIENIMQNPAVTSSNASQIIQDLFELPTKMREVIEKQEEIGKIAKNETLTRRSWATVGNGPNSIAAREIRIKSSELCYKAIALDSTEDKKHIDLSSEPLIIVCATGMDGANADDIAKEVAIYRAHKACPIVITDDLSDRFDATDCVITVPKIDKDISFILAALAGHILGYETAKAIDDTAQVLRKARGALAEITPEQLESPNGIEYLGAALAEPGARFFETLDEGKYDSVLDASESATLTRLFVALAPPYMTSILSSRCGGLLSPASLMNCAVSTLTTAIDQLTRPIDAIRHQAKTVTVGISRSDDTLLKSQNVIYLLEHGVPRDVLTFQSIRTLLALDEIIDKVTGHTRYEIHGDGDELSLSIVEQVGSSAGLVSRVTQNPKLRGTKRLAAREQSVWIVKGKSDGRNVILVPEVMRSKTIGITILHFDVKNESEVSLDSRKRVLEGYKQRLFAIRDAVTETKDDFDETVLCDIGVMELLTEPVVNLARYWL